MEQHTFQIQLEGLIKLLAQNLYADPDVFIREMVQNAHDSIVRRKELAGKGPSAAGLPSPRIDVVAAEDPGTITIHDNGSGMSREEIGEYLATIGRSGTAELRDRLREADRSRTVDLIGQFGIGLLSAFIVAAEVEVVTLAEGGEPLRFWSDGSGTYTLDDAPERVKVGSTVILHLRPEHRRYVVAERLQGILRTYADFIGVPIHLNGGADPANAVDAPWHRHYAAPAERRDAYAQFWERRFMTEHSLHVFAVDEEVAWDDLDQPDGVAHGRVHGVLAITDRHVPDVNARGIVDVYVKRMFINSANREALPPWARFIQGVIESDALTPNAARDNVMRNGGLAAVRKALGDLIVAELTRLSANEPARCKEILRWHSYHVLAMCAQEEHEEFFEAVADLVPLESDQGPLTVAEYLADAPRRSDGFKQIYYIAERGSANQYYLLAAARGMRVFNCGEPFAEEFLERYARRWPERAKLARLDVAASELIFEPLDAEERARFRDLEAAYPVLFPELACIAEVSRFKPVQVPAVLTEGRGSKNRREMRDVAENLVMPEFIRNMVKGFLDTGREPVTLHLNAENDTVQKLGARGDLRDEVSRNALAALYNNAVMFQARAITPSDMTLMFTQYNRVIELMLALSAERTTLERDLATRLQELSEAKSAAGGDTRTAHVSCFVALPYRDEGARRLYEALEKVLEAEPYCWEVRRADDEVRESGLWDNLKSQMVEAHCFIAIVSGANPNVMIEVGRMEALGRPILLIRLDETEVLPADLTGRLVATVSATDGTLLGDVRAMLEKQTEFLRQDGERYLSPVTLQAANLSEEAARRVCRHYRTWDQLLDADSERVASETGMTKALVEAVKEDLRQRSR